MESVKNYREREREAQRERDRESKVEKDREREIESRRTSCLPYPIDNCRQAKREEVYCSFLCLWQLF